jgi:site-specific recombinase XerD
MDNSTEESTKGFESLAELIAGARRQMEETGYTPSTRRRYADVWGSLRSFARKVEKTDRFSVELTERFLVRNYPSHDCPHPLPPQFMQEVSALRLLTEFHLRGRIKPRRYPDRRLSLPVHFREVLAEYEQYCISAGQRAATLRMRRQQITTLLIFLHRAGVEHVSQVRPVHVSDFLFSQRYHSPGALGITISLVRCFIRYLQACGILQHDVAGTVPKTYHCSYAKIPSVWTTEEVEALLAQVDRGSPQGKRDYAILLLAARLGIRVGDIIRLRLEHLRWDDKRIEFSQSKTGQPLVLPLSEEVGWALIDYLRNGRPAVAHREVFVACNPPFRPFAHGNNLQYLITRYRRQAGIAVDPRRPGGLHRLRHSLASRLLQAGIPLTTISDILGHRSVESTYIYTKVNLPQLQTCALDPEEVHHA